MMYSSHNRQCFHVNEIQFKINRNISSNDYYITLHFLLKISLNTLDN